MDRFSEYRVMWVLVLFDLPTETKKEKRRMWISGKIYKEMDLRCFSFLFMSAIVLVARMRPYM